MSELIGLSGASLAGYAYLPQIRLLLPAAVFIVLGGIQIGAISVILFFSARYRGLACPTHTLNPAHDSL